MSRDPNLPEPPPRPPRVHRGGSPTALNTKEEQLAQAASMMASRLFEFKSLERVAKDHHVSTATAQRRLKLARREGVPEMARNILIRDALPVALAVVLDSLKSSDEAMRVKSAWKLLDGLEAMKLPEEDRALKKLGVGEEDSYEVWRERIKVTKGAIERADQSIRRPPPDDPVTRVDALPPGVAAADAPDDPGEPKTIPLRPSDPIRPADEAEEDSEGDRDPGDI